MKTKKMKYIAERLYDYDKKHFASKEIRAIDKLSEQEKIKFWELLENLKSNPLNFIELKKMGVIENFNELTIDKEGNIEIHTGIFGVADIILKLNLIEAKDFYPGG